MTCAMRARSLTRAAATASCRHTLISLALILVMLVGFTWNKYNIPRALATVDPVLVTGPGAGVILTVVWAKLMTNDATWHLGKLKRTIIRGFFALALATTFWVLEESGVTPCPSVLTLHPLWHIFSAHALVCMTCFCKYHRGRLFGFKVELRGHWLCPYTVWLEPESVDRNPIARHTSSSQLVSAQRRASKRMSITAIAGEVAGKVPIRRQRGSIMGSGKLAGRRNSYCMAQVARCRWHVKSRHLPGSWLPCRVDRHELLPSVCILTPLFRRPWPR